MFFFVDRFVLLFFFFFFNDTATTEIYTLSYTTLFRSGLRPAPAGGLQRHVHFPLAAVEHRRVPRLHRGVGASLYLLRERRSEEHTSELQSPCNLVCRLLLEKKKNKNEHYTNTLMSPSLHESLI